MSGVFPFMMVMRICFAYSKFAAAYSGSSSMHSFKNLMRSLYSYFLLSLYFLNSLTADALSGSGQSLSFFSPLSSSWAMAGAQAKQRRKENKRNRFILFFEL